MYIVISLIDCFGEKGENCSIPCEIPNYGYNCENVCSCKKNEVCNKYFGCIPFGKRVVGLGFLGGGTGGGDFNYQINKISFFINHIVIRLID